MNSDEKLRAEVQAARLARIEGKLDRLTWAVGVLLVFVVGVPILLQLGLID